MMDIILLRFSKIFSNQEPQYKPRGASFEAGVRGPQNLSSWPSLEALCVQHPVSAPGPLYQGLSAGTQGEWRETPIGG